MDHINNVTKIRYSTLSIYYQLFRLLLKHDFMYVNHMLFKITLITLYFHTMNNIKLLMN